MCFRIYSLHFFNKNELNSYEYHDYMWGWMLAKVIFMTLIPNVDSPLLFQVEQKKYTLEPSTPTPYVKDRPVLDIYTRSHKRVQRIHTCSTKLIHVDMRI